MFTPLFSIDLRDVLFAVVIGASALYAAYCAGKREAHHERDLEAAHDEQLRQDAYAFRALRVHGRN